MSAESDTPSPPLPNRRRFLALAGAALAGLCLPGTAAAFGPVSLFRMPVLEYAGNWDKRAGAPPRLMWELMKRTSIEATLDPATIRLDAPDLTDHTVLYLSGDASFPPFPEGDLSRLRRFLLYGGTLFIDGNPDGGEGFDSAVRRLTSDLFPETPMAILPDDHTLFKSFYLLDGRWGRVSHRATVEGVTREDRTPILYSQNDVGGAWMRDAYGNWTHPVIPGGERQREMAFRFGVNLVMYALCTTYKSDQVHIPFILRRTRR